MYMWQCVLLSASKQQRFLLFLVTLTFTTFGFGQGARGAEVVNHVVPPQDTKPLAWAHNAETLALHRYNTTWRRDGGRVSLLCDSTCTLKSKRVF